MEGSRSVGEVNSWKAASGRRNNWSMPQARSGLIVQGPIRGSSSRDTDLDCGEFVACDVLEELPEKSDAGNGILEIPQNPLAIYTRDMVCDGNPASRGPEDGGRGLVTRTWDGRRLRATPSVSWQAHAPPAVGDLLIDRMLTLSGRSP